MRCPIQFPAVLALAALALGQAAAADKKDKPDSKPPTPGEFVSVGEVKAQLARAPGEKGGSITLRFDQVAITNAGTVGRLMDLYHGRTAPQFKESHIDKPFDLTSDVKVRRMRLPPKTDEKGKKLQYTEKELKELKGDTNMRGYNADLGDLKPGQSVRVHVVKAKGATGDTPPLYVNRIYIEAEGTLATPDKDKKKNQ
jgi:hypothetical protein